MAFRSPSNTLANQHADPEVSRLTRRLNRERAARKEAELIAESATKVSIEDPLTGLFNRTLILTTLENELTRARRKQTDVTVLFIDLDHFKQVNDTHGHEIGDKVLVAVANMLRETVEIGDSVGRLGGDEFVVIAAEIGEEEALRLGGRLVTAIESDRTTQIARGNRISASIGIARFDGTATADELLNRADTAMYTAKQSEDRCYFYDNALRERDEQLRLIRRRLPAAIRDREFSVHYQPIFTLPDRRLMFFESLLRWDLCDGADCTIDKVINIAQESGYIAELGAYMLDTVAEETRQACAGIGTPLPPVTVNVSPRELIHDHYANSFAEVLARHQLPGSALIVEITESALLQSGPNVDRNLCALRDMGVLLALDDFGTGYSSLGRLRHHTFDIIKVDASFVSGVVENRHDSAIIAAIVAMGNALGTRVIAEGVETEDQFNAVCTLGCHAAQGWFFSHEIDANALCDYISGSSSGIS